MNINFALEYIPRRMEELGHGDNYALRLRHLVLKPNERLEIDAYNQLYVLIEEAEDVHIESLTGIFDLSIKNANEMQYEHQGSISIRNLSEINRHVRFIQVIPKHNKIN